MSDGSEPHDHILVAVHRPGAVAADMGGRGVPGVVGIGWVPEGCYTGTQALPSQDPYLTIFWL